MKKEFFTAELELIFFSTDVISTSPNDGGFELPPWTPRSIDLSLDF